MRRAIKQVVDGKSAKIQGPDRTRDLVDRIRKRRERIWRRVGILPNSAEMIRQDRER